MELQVIFTDLFFWTEACWLLVPWLGIWTCAPCTGSHSLTSFCSPAFSIYSEHTLSLVIRKSQKHLHVKMYVYQFSTLLFVDFISASKKWKSFHYSRQYEYTALCMTEPTGMIRIWSSLFISQALLTLGLTVKFTWGTLPWPLCFKMSGDHL